MSQFIGRAAAIIEADDRRALPVRWRRVSNLEVRDLRWPRSRLDAAAGWLEATWYEWPTLFGWTGQPVPFIHTLTPTIGGSAPARPVYTLTLPATDYSIQSVYIVNTTQDPDQQITINRAVRPADS